MTFQTLEIDGELQVIPIDAVPYIAAGTVDIDLFEVSTLLDEGYADSEDLPLIVSWSDEMRTADMSIAGAERTRLLPSLNAAAVSAEQTRGGAIWRALTPGQGPVATPPRSGSPARLAAGIAHVWLDGRVEATLDRSVPQIGAPAAWDAGYRGTGVEVAVLDTGVDSQHPDLIDRIAQARDFTASPSGTADAFGHGTHVASIIAGTGASSGGSHTGVAPEVDLLVGKVLGDDGFGFESEIIAGMEWAAAEGAAVVNMSLGGGPSDGTDPLSLAVDAISRQSGTLFVVAAGNDGADEAVSTPSVAATALSVAAVDRDESLAPFSSRGPRTGDGGLKPEISAPGVGIQAARATDTSMGTPINQYYTAASGTSMATPHVAGAAALLAQRHPGWTGERIKSALMSTAAPNPELGVYEQGAGRVDVRRAIEQQVTATGSADFGRRSVNDAESVSQRTVTYRNESDEAVTMTLATSLSSMESDVAADAAVSAPSQVTVPAHGSTSVDVQLNSDGLSRGRWTGWLIASTAGGIVVRTAVGAVVSAPRHTLTLRFLGFDGEPTFVPSLAVIGDHIGTENLTYVGLDGKVELNLEDGEYVVHGVIGDSKNVQAERVGSLIDPYVSVTGDLELVLDARDAQPIEIKTPQVAEPQAVVSWSSHRIYGNSRKVSFGVMTFDRTQPWVTPTRPVPVGAFEFSSRWQLVRPSALVSVVGRDFRPETTLLPESPLFDRLRRFELVAPGADMRGVRGKVAVLDAPDPGVEPDLVRAAAQAGASAAILIRPEWNSIRTVFEPGLDRGPIPALLTTTRDGAQLVAELRRPGKTMVDVETSRSSPYLYDVMQVSRDAIPQRILHTVTKSNSHRVNTTYVDSGGMPFALEQRFGWRPWATYAWADSERMTQTGHSRVEWVSSGDTVWQHRVAYHGRRSLAGPLMDGMVSLPQTYGTGVSEESWFDPVVRPAAVPWSPSTRTGDRILLQVPQFVDAAGHYSVDPAVTNARVFRNDELLMELPQALGGVDVPEADAKYRVELDVSNADPEWDRGIRSTTSWVFRSGRPEAGATVPLPMLQVAYRVPTDAMGTATRNRHTIRLQVTDQAGHALPSAVLSAEVSFDDGESWQRLTVRRLRDEFAVEVPEGSQSVSLRVHASDGSSRVEQEVIRAYDRH